MHMTAPVIHYMRRDIRLTDNTALNAAHSSGSPVAVVFVVDPRQVGEENAYRSQHALCFMRESLETVDNDLKEQGSGLTTLYGLPEEELPRFAKKIGAQALYYNRDYTPFSRRRDSALEGALHIIGIPAHAYEDALLNPPGTVRTGSDELYKVFTPFYNAASRVSVAFPTSATGSYFPSVLADAHVGFTELTRYAVSTGTPRVHGGRHALAERLSFLGQLTNYSVERDYPGTEGTSHLSAYLKFGVISPREAYHALKKALPNHYVPLTRQLYWRDFFTHIAADMPEVFGHSFKSEYDAVPWDDSTERFARWQQGTTGFPIVDAGMRELRETGWMHNRARMIVASFLTKDLHLDWRLGEKHFATLLIDYDPAVNNGSWQWVAGTGADAQPWFRIFNPWLQQKKFDPQATYIRRYIPELAEVPVEAIHAWNSRYEHYPSVSYPPPMVDHSLEAKETLRRFKEALSRQKRLV